VTAIDVKFQAPDDALRRVAEQNGYRLVDAPDHGRYMIVPADPALLAPQGAPPTLTFAEAARYFGLADDGTPRFPSVPLADDPELAEHAEWNQEIADDLEAWSQKFGETGRVIACAQGAAQELRLLAARTEEASAVYRCAIADLHKAGLSYAQIADALGISRGSVQGHVERARREAGDES